MSEDTQAVAIPELPGDDKIAELVQTGDVGQLDPTLRGRYLFNLAKSLGLNPLSRPFDFIKAKGQDGGMRTILYANRSASDQIRFNYKISTEIIYEGPLMVGETAYPEVYCVKFLLKMPILNSAGGEYFRTETSVGCVPIGIRQGDKMVMMTGEGLANAIMKCHTKALRRGTLAMAGLGFPDESETETIPGIVQNPDNTQPVPRILTPPVEAPPSDTPSVTPRIVGIPKPLPAAKPPRA